MQAQPFHDETQSVNTQDCPECETKLDFSDCEPLSDVFCPKCGAKVTVRCSLGLYRITAIAGRGGMGVVYKAYDLTLNRYVAVKLLRKDHSENQKLIRQLAEEAVISATVAHPHVGRVFATGTDHGRFYIVMELIEKGSLLDLIQQRGQVAEAQVLQVGIQISEGLRAAHERGLIHRDIKPGNILFTNNYAAKIVDFGLAQFEAEARGSTEIWGTPYYLPPERLDGLPEDIRSDIYALGATLFHAIAGRPLFEAKNATQVALKHLKSQPASLQAFAPNVSSTTAFVINRMLAKDPAERFQSYSDLIVNFQYARDEISQSKPKARVVMETEADQRVWGWAVLTMLGVAILLVIVTAISGNRIFGTQKPVVEAATPAPEEAVTPPPRIVAPVSTPQPDSETPHIAVEPPVSEPSSAVDPAHDETVRRYEAETLEIADSSGDKTATFEEAKASNRRTFQFFASKIGDFITFRIPNLPEGHYQVAVGFKSYIKRAIVQTFIGVEGDPLLPFGQPFDQFGENSEFSVVTIGDWTQRSSGNLLIRFRVKGKNPSSKSLDVSVDYISLIKQ